MSSAVIIVPIGVCRMDHPIIVMEVFNGLVIWSPSMVCRGPYTILVLYYTLL